MNIDEILSSLPARPTAKTREWFKVRASVDPMVADVEIYDYIGSVLNGVTAKDFIAALSKLPEGTKTINVHVSSLGGDVFEALAMANALRNHPAVVVAKIEGLAASAATIVTMGGCDRIEMADNALVMIHEPVMDAYGDAAQLRTLADALDRIHAAILATYQQKSTLSADELTAMMAAETWMDATEALAAGFATEVIEGVRAAASIDPRALATLKVPEKHKAKATALTAQAKPLGRRPVRIKNAAPVVAGDQGPSIEEFCDAVREALRSELGDPWACCCGNCCGGACGWYVIETYKDGVVLNRNGGTWFYPITVSGDGDEITLGDAIEVDMVWVREAEDAPAATATAPKVINVGRMSAAAVIAAAPPVPTTKPADVAVAAAGDVVSLCAAAGLDIAFAQTLIASKPAASALAGLIDGEKAKRATALARAKDIRAVCAKAKQEDLAEGYIDGAMTLAQVKDHLLKITAKLDKAEIDTGIKPDQGRPKAVLSVREIYAERARQAAASRN
jgi:ATP-dependent protease ClpP protease subunit